MTSCVNETMATMEDIKCDRASFTSVEFMFDCSFHLNLAPDKAQDGTRRKSTFPLLVSPREKSFSKMIYLQDVSDRIRCKPKSASMGAIIHLLQRRRNNNFIMNHHIKKETLSRIEEKDDRGIEYHHPGGAESTLTFLLGLLLAHFRMNGMLCCILMKLSKLFPSLMKRQELRVRELIDVLSKSDILASKISSSQQQDYSIRHLTKPAENCQENETFNKQQGHHDEAVHEDHWGHFADFDELSVHDSICQRLSYPDFWDPFSLDYDNHESLEDGENEEKDFVLEDISVKEEDLRKAEEMLQDFFGIA